MTPVKQDSLELLFLVILFPAVLTVGAGFLFFLSVPVTAAHFPAALGIAVGACWVLHKRTRWFTPDGELTDNRRFRRITALFLGIVLISLILALAIPDREKPGEELHRGAVSALSGGWNPYHQPFPESRVFSSGITTQAEMRQIDHQPSASRILAASAVKLTGIFAAGRWFHFYILMAPFLMAWIFLSVLNRVTPSSRWIIAVLTSLNPVSLYQMASFYNDGVLSALTTVAIIACFYYAMFRDNRMNVILAPTLIVLANIKFSGIIYGFSIVLMTWLAVFIMDRHGQGRFLRMAALSALIAIGVAGYQPYVTNTVYIGQPYYQAEQPEAAPDAFTRLFSPIKIVYSVFSRSSADANEMPVIKLPFSLHESEVAAFRDPGVRYGGFGPYFGGVFLLSFAVLIILGRSNRLVILFGLIALGIILLSTLLNPAAWWARQAPQLWLLPLTFMVIFYYTPQHEFIHYLRGFILAALFLNCLMVLRLV